MLLVVLIMPRNIDLVNSSLTHLRLNPLCLHLLRHIHSGLNGRLIIRLSHSLELLLQEPGVSEWDVYLAPGVV